MTHALADMNMTGRAALFARPVKVTQLANSNYSELMEFTEETTAFLFGNAADLNVVDCPPPVVAGVEQTER